MFHLNNILSDDQLIDEALKPSDCKKLMMSYDLLDALHYFLDVYVDSNFNDLSKKHDSSKLGFVLLLDRIVYLIAGYNMGLYFKEMMSSLVEFRAIFESLIYLKYMTIDGEDQLGLRSSRYFWSQYQYVVGLLLKKEGIKRNCSKVIKDSFTISQSMANYINKYRKEYINTFSNAGYNFKKDYEIGDDLMFSDKSLDHRSWFNESRDDGNDCNSLWKLCWLLDCQNDYVNIYAPGSSYVHSDNNGDLSVSEHGISIPYELDTDYVEILNEYLFDILYSLKDLSFKNDTFFSSVMSHISRRCVHFDSNFDKHGNFKYPLTANIKVSHRLYENSKLRKMDPISKVRTCQQWMALKSELSKEDSIDANNN